MVERFFLVTPAHNESAEAADLVQCVRASSLRPTRWLVVDDRSTDGTGAAFESAGADLPFLRVQRITTEGEYMAFRYSEVVRAGLEQLDIDDECLVGILDADIRFGPTYWQKLSERMAQDPRLGVVSGALCARSDAGSFRLESGQYLDLPRGGLRLMRGACLRQVGGVHRARSPDTVVTLLARQHGWSTRLLDDVVAFSTRPTGTRADYKNAAKSYGQRYWDVGRPAWFSVYKSLRHLMKGRPQQAAGVLEGYFGQWLSGVPRSANRGMIRHYRWEPQRRAYQRWLSRITGIADPAAAVPVREVSPQEFER